MSIKTRVEKLEDERPQGSQRPIYLWGWDDETTDEVIARWQAENPDEDLKGRPVQILTWKRPQ